jgi:hypothetical protein
MDDQIKATEIAAQVDASIEVRHQYFVLIDHGEARAQLLNVLIAPFNKNYVSTECPFSCRGTNWRRSTRRLL